MRKKRGRQETNNGFLVIVQSNPVVNPAQEALVVFFSLSQSSLCCKQCAKRREREGAYTGKKGRES